MRQTQRNGSHAVHKERNRNGMYVMNECVAGRSAGNEALPVRIVPVVPPLRRTDADRE